MPYFDSERHIEAIQIRNRIAEIERTIYSQRQPIGNLELCVTGTGKGPERAPQTGWKPFKVLGMWGGFDQTTWFRMRVTIPEAMKGRRVVAFVRTAQASFVPGAPDMNEGGEALAYLNGVPFQGLDRNRDELYLTEKARGGETFDTRNVPEHPARSSARLCVRGHRGYESACLGFLLGLHGDV